MTEENKTTAEETAEEVKETEAAENEVTEATPETQAGSEEVEETKEKKLFGKKKKDKKDEKIEELTDRVKRQMAEFENFRKRTEKEKAGMYAVGAKDVIEKILPVVDNFERGLDVAEDKEDPFVQGMFFLRKPGTGDTGNPLSARYRCEGNVCNAMPWLVL